MVKAASKKPRAKKGPEPVSKPLTSYIQAAMGHAEYKFIDDPNPVFAEIPPCPGLWASAKTLEACREELQEVLEEWIVLGFRLGHPMPVIDGIDLNHSLEPRSDA